MNVAKILIPVIALAPFALRAQSATSVEGLRQDVASLRDEVARLRGEIEDLKTAQAASAKASAGNARTENAALAARVAALETASSASGKKADRSELLRLDGKIEELRSDVKKALADQTRQVNDALKSGPAAKPAVAPVEAKKPPVENKPAAAPKVADLPADMPKTGVRYTVHRGDSVSRIAKKMNSKPEWILAANGMKSNADLKADAVIFVPQPDTGN